MHIFVSSQHEKIRTNRFNDLTRHLYKYTYFISKAGDKSSSLFCSPVDVVSIKSTSTASIVLSLPWARGNAVAPYRIWLWAGAITHCNSQHEKFVDDGLERKFDFGTLFYSSAIYYMVRSTDGRRSRLKKMFPSKLHISWTSLSKLSFQWTEITEFQL